MEFNRAVSYVNKIKNRFIDAPAKYKEFLDILQRYKQSKPIKDVYAEVRELFDGQADLLDEFRLFLPDPDAPPPDQDAPQNNHSAQSSSFNFNRRPAPTSSAGTAFQPMSLPPTETAASIPPRKKPKTHATTSSTSNTMEELEFFDKVKKAINYKPTYNEFLKVLNLFSQEVIDAQTLVERVSPFLEGEEELMIWFKRFVKWEEDDVVFNTPMNRITPDFSSYERVSKSYRILPKEYLRGTCTGRDAHCDELLNDDYHSHPSATAEDGGNFNPSKPTNPYQEALFKCEDERYEFSRHIEVNMHAIQTLQPLSKQLSEMPEESRSSFRIPENFFTNKIWIFAIKKLYDKDRGQEVVEAIHSHPSLAIPLVLKRLVQKDEEWRRSLREWNKVWAECERVNYDRAHDYHLGAGSIGVAGMTSKKLISEIEGLARVQKGDAARVGVGRYQYEFIFRDPNVQADVRRIVVHSVEASVDDSDLVEMKRKVNSFMRVLFGRFLRNRGEEEVGSDVFDDFIMQSSKSSEDMEIDEDSSSINMNRERRRELFASIGSSSEITSDNEVIGVKGSHAFYTNSSIFVLFRLYQMFYSRLARMKAMSKDLAENPPPVVNSVALDIGLQQHSDLDFNADDRYTDLLLNLYDLIDEKVDSVKFEDVTRAMFTTYVYVSHDIDKLVVQISKQIMIILDDPQSMHIINLFYKERETENSVRREAVYRLTVESSVQEDNLYRLEYNSTEKSATVQLLAKEDYVHDDSITTEEKWSVYVDHFVQLSSKTISGSDCRRQPFLKRNLLSHPPSNDAERVTTRSGLELKICVNTYKIFFVDGTEDYFRRRRAAVPIERPGVLGELWKRGLDDAEIQRLEKEWRERVEGKLLIQN